jgi:hypothetical protein
LLIGRTSKSEKSGEVLEDKIIREEDGFEVPETTG